MVIKPWQKVSSEPVGNYRMGASWHCPRLAGGPEFIPVVVVAGFCE
jgi:hypothetical protein